MLSKLFLGMSLIGAEWVLYLLVLISVFSVALILERIRFYREAGRGLEEFRKGLRQAVTAGHWDEALKLARSRAEGTDLEAALALALLSKRTGGGSAMSSEVLCEIAQDAMLRARLGWDKNLATLATIGANSPFVGLFGTVLGIIKAFHDLSQQVGAGAQTVTAGISEALIATAVGIMVAIPAVVAFNLFQRKVKAAKTEAEALKSFLIGSIGLEGR